MAHKSQDELRQSLGHAETLVPRGATYAHYKHPDQTYTVTGHAILEASDAVGIIYRAEYGERMTFVRALESWLENVEHNGKLVPRFSQA